MGNSYATSKEICSGSSGGPGLVCHSTAISSVYFCVHSGTITEPTKPRGRPSESGWIVVAGSRCVRWLRRKLVFIQWRSLGPPGGRVVRDVVVNKFPGRLRYVRPPPTPDAPSEQDRISNDVDLLRLKPRRRSICCHDVSQEGWKYCRSTRNRMLQVRHWPHDEL